MTQAPRARRVTANRPITLQGEHARANGKIINISASGLLVKSPVRAREGTRLGLIFDLPTRERFIPIKTIGRVARLIEEGDHYLLGIMFENPGDDLRQAIESYIDYVESIKQNASVRRRST
ncbi:PilZ domain-containing protein [Sulfurivirga caldicuralii]|uniref:PilZ domain-containing protein n=1 Tax=Sulfurivirga caldicuralii TaxID=364032 RepID=A0A1N6GK73_9GAMM|nr:PilZ domain-containing protein [Sulfurivirga caldicuralii]SIO07887.1 PilZ domain-containing protein [Sulfurivirga caldicuralii]